MCKVSKIKNNKQLELRITTVTLKELFLSWIMLVYNCVGKRVTFKFWFP